MVSHTERFCSNHDVAGGGDDVKEWGNWLRAPLRRVAVQSQSKWLRDENDDGDLAVTEPRADIGKINSLSSAKIQVFNIASNVLYEINEDDNMGLHLEERKRQRSEVETVGHMEIDLGHQLENSITEHATKENAISSGDLTASTNQILAELARQANHQQ